KIHEAVKEAFIYDDVVIIEENIDGKEVGCSVVGNHKLMTGRVNEIEVSEGFFSFEEKYTLKTSKIHTPARIDPKDEKRLQEVGKKVFQTLGCRGYARIDLFLKKDGEIVFSEANTIPGFTAQSQLPRMMKAAGIDYPELVDILIELALEAETGEWYGIAENKPKPDIYGRAWVEINMNALVHNIADIRRASPPTAEIMAVLKADAYGHGVERVARRLVREGIKAFAVATVAEGVKLRSIVPDGEILVLGSAHPNDIDCLLGYKLTQLIVDDFHAKMLNDAINKMSTDKNSETDKTTQKLNIHVAIDTGMHRLGIESDNFEEIEKIFNYKNLIVVGTATHLASPDSLKNDDIDFTKLQMDRFYSVVQKLKNKGYDAGKLHTQSSYGIYNYPELLCDYTRPGIMLFGVHSQDDETKCKSNLRPMLSLKADISQVRWIKAGESVSYSRLYTATKPIKIATIGIGYADGIPRQMTGKGGMAIVGGKKVPIIGRICMDMLILDVTEVDDVKAGDVAIFIGSEGDETIHCEEVAAAAGTITNDILCRLGNRLPRIYI
ncbi:MAG: serine racemase VanT catalytic subunit, partial [Oscillospiraceae bacterium]|nr:serine racemase VanT catalytic subunit [Oscillospiraceae bacterium]